MKSCKYYREDGGCDLAYGLLVDGLLLDGLLLEPVVCLVEKLYDFYYKHWGFKRWTFGDKWNAMIYREDMIAYLKTKEFQLKECSELKKKEAE
jgi:hypothetical protein